MTDFHKDGLMTVEEMKCWIADTKPRKLWDLCLVASGYNPTDPITKEINPLREPGSYAQRIYMNLTSANEKETNPAYKIREHIDPEFPNTIIVHRDDFIEWLMRSNMNDYEPCARLLAAWDIYKFNSKYHDSTPKHKKVLVYKCVLNVIESENLGVRDQSKAIDLLLSPKYRELHKHLYTRPTKDGLKPSKRYSKGTITEYCTKAREILELPKVRK